MLLTPVGFYSFLWSFAISLIILFHVTLLLSLFEIWSKFKLKVSEELSVAMESVVLVYSSSPPSHEGGSEGGSR